MSAIPRLAALCVGGVLAAAALPPAPGARAEDKPRPPRLRMLVLANTQDEPKSLKAAAKQLADAFKGAKGKAELQKVAKDGLPPPAPKASSDWAPGYVWVELGPSEVRALRLDAGAKDDPKFGALAKRLAKQAEAARAKGETFEVPGLSRCLVYSRACLSTKLSAKEREKKGYEYFVLAREPHKGKGVTGRHLTKASVTTDKDLVAIDVRLSKEGGDLLHALTDKNRPTGPKGSPFRRHLAVVLDGQVITAPAVNDPIRDRAQITGHFTRAEAEAIAKAMRADAPGGKK
jgi:hypothetical protein